MSEIKLYGNIEDFSWFEDDVTLERVNSLLETAAKDEDLTVRINTFGGSVDAGFAIYAALRRFSRDNSVKIITRQDGYCASIGTVVFLAGDERIGNKWSEPFVHNAWTIAMGDAGQLMKTAADLETCNDKIARFYSERTSMDYETARDYMTNETFIPAEKCLEYGFYTELENLEGVFARYNFNKNKLPMKENEVKQMIEDSNKGFFNSIKAWFKKTTKFVAVMLTDATGMQIEFPDVPDGVEPVVGDTAIYSDGTTTNGEVVMADGATYVFDNGTLTEIKPKAVEDEPAPAPTETEITIEQANEAVNALKAENEALKAQITQVQNDLISIRAEIKSGIATPSPEEHQDGNPSAKSTRKLSDIRK